MHKLCAFSQYTLNLTVVILYFHSNCNFLVLALNNKVCKRYGSLHMLRKLKSVFCLCLGRLHFTDLEHCCILHANIKINILSGFILGKSIFTQVISKALQMGHNCQQNIQLSWDIGKCFVISLPIQCHAECVCTGDVCNTVFISHFGSPSRVRSCTISLRRHHLSSTRCYWELSHLLMQSQKLCL